MMKPSQQARPGRQGPSSAVGRLKRGSRHTVLGQAVGIGAALGTQVVLARVLTPSDFGLYATIWAFVIVGGTVARLGLGRTGGRAVASALARDCRQSAAYLVVATTVLAVTAAILVVPLLSTALALVTHTALSVGLTLGIAVAASLEGCRYVSGELIRGYYRYGLVQLVGLPGRNLILLLLVSGLTATRHLDLTSALWALIAVNIVSAVTAIASSLTVAQISGISLTNLRSHLAIPLQGGFLLLIADVTSIVLTQAPLISLGSMQLPQEAGVYAVGLRFSSLLAIVSLIIISVYTPVVNSLAALGKNSELETQARAAATRATMVSALGYLILAASGPILIPVLFGTTYRNGYAIALVLALAPLAQAATGLCGVVLIAYGHEKLVALVFLTAAIGLALGLMVFVPTYGAIAAAVAGTAVATAQNLILVGVARRKTGIWTPFHLPRWRTGARSW